MKFALKTFIFFAFFGSFIANEKPLYCTIKGESVFPVFQEWVANLGITQTKNYNVLDWAQCSDCQAVIRTAIPYSSKTIDSKNSNFKSPFDTQDISSWRYRHWLGTDQLGQDVLAGIITGTNTAFIIGIGATILAILIGTFFGILAGYFGDNKIKLSLFNIFTLLFTSFFLMWITMQMPIYQSIIMSIIGFLIIFYLIHFIEKRVIHNQKKYPIPLDSLIFRSIEVIRSIPTLFFLLLLIAIVGKCNQWQLLLFLSLLSWMYVAIFVRAEVLKVKYFDYIQAAKSLGLSNFQTITKHVLPNVTTPIAILFATMVTGLIMAESSLSFLGIGLPLEQVTWGSMLRQAQNNIEAWWLALFPGLCLFGVGLLFNLMAEKWRLGKIG